MLFLNIFLFFDTFIGLLFKDTVEAILPMHKSCSSQKCFLCSFLIIHRRIVTKRDASVYDNKILSLQIAPAPLEESVCIKTIGSKIFSSS